MSLKKLDKLDKLDILDININHIQVYYGYKYLYY